MLFGADFFVRSSTLPPLDAFRVSTIAKNNDETMNSPAASVVAFDSIVADPRGPNAVWEPIPPNAPARSAALPLCSNTTPIKKTHTAMWIKVRIIVILLLRPA